VAAVNVMFVLDAACDFGGAERLTITVMNRLAQRGHECHAVFIKSHPAGRLDRLRLGDSGTRLTLDAGRHFDLGALRAFAAHLARVRPAAIVATMPHPLMYASLARRRARLRVPLAVTYHSTRLPGVKLKLKMLAYRPFFWLAERTVFVCEAQKRYCMRRGLFSRRNEVIHNGVDTDEFCDDGSAGRRMRRHTVGFSAADYVIGSVALLRPEKNHQQLVDAVAALRRTGIPARALLIGDGEMRAAIEARARELGVAGHVVITGLQHDVRPYVAACDVMALCSLTETFSLAALEAMAMGKPVIHSALGGAAEMIVPGRNGFLFPAGDTRALVQRLALLAERALRERMGNEARAVVKSLFSEKVMVDRYERLLLELCGARPAAATVQAQALHQTAEVK
jgi:L-malate glycosyltransferase